MRRTIRDGIAGTSMSPFVAVMNSSEIEQVIDYVMFLSMRGEVEKGLIYFGQDASDETADEDLSEETY